MLHKKLFQFSSSIIALAMVLTVGSLPARADVVAPQIVSAILEANGLTVKFTFDEDMKPINNSLTGLTIKVDGVSKSIASSSIPGNPKTVLTVTLNAPAVEQGSEVTYEYLASGNLSDNSGGPGNPLLETSGIVQNQSTVVGQPPIASSATLAADGVSLTLMLSKPLKVSDSPSGFTVRLGGISVPFEVGDIAAGGSSLLFTLVTKVQEDLLITLDYSAVTDQIEDFGGRDLASFTDLPVNNLSGEPAAVPTVTTRALNQTGTILTVTFSENMESRSPATGFTVLVDGQPVNATIGTIQGGGVQLEILLENPVSKGSLVTLSFTGGLDEIEDLKDHDLVAFVNQPVENNSGMIALVLDSNFPNGPSDSIQYLVANVPTEIPTNPFNRPGYIFNGWKSESDGSGDSYADGAIIQADESLTLFADWTAVIQSISYSAGGASGTVPSQAGVGTGSTITVLAPTNLSWAGNFFNGWSDGSSVIQPGSPYTVGASPVSFVALWRNIPSAPIPVSMPSNVIALAGNGSVTVTWEMARLGQRDLAPTNFVLEYSTDGGVTWLASEATGSGLSRTATGLKNGVAYIFRVRAEAANAASTSAPSNSVVPIDPSSVQDPTTNPNSFAGRKVTIASFDGALVIYTSGYIGSRMTARIGGRWIKVDRISNLPGRTFSLTKRSINPGFNVNVRVYIDGRLVSSAQVTTR
jgi:uncharacterized repeat protein (TIGR02059 family)/uncharacterized repeat protein (TIGR02543 family)